MAFIKRSVSKPINAKVGNRVLKCSSCGMPFVSKTLSQLCPGCNTETKDEFEIEQDKTESEQD